MSNEKLRYLNGLIDVKPQLHVLDLSAFLQDYIVKFTPELDFNILDQIPIEVEIEK